MPSEKCTISLTEPLSPDRCMDTKSLRQYVMCNAHKIMTEEKSGFGPAIRRSWAEAKKVCTHK